VITFPDVSILLDETMWKESEGCRANQFPIGFSEWKQSLEFWSTNT